MSVKGAAKAAGCMDVEVDANGTVTAVIPHDGMGVAAILARNPGHGVEIKYTVRMPSKTFERWLNLMGFTSMTGMGSEMVATRFDAWCEKEGIRPNTDEGRAAYLGWAAARDEFLGGSG